ncbi:hypothetical protein RRG08_018302 [Elysia crispata]|uniref:Uncharacterized protein n=1 Tax=Elysia crispata TaxID=231223 RepID=A0AAE0YJH1_9GAST|nr:hypothetical protein RRG08_018302 [Elysia crispata]
MKVSSGSLQRLACIDNRRKDDVKVIQTSNTKARRNGVLHHKQASGVTPDLNMSLESRPVNRLAPPPRAPRASY